MVVVAIPGGPSVTLHHAVFDLNGTLARDGVLVDSVPQLAAELRGSLACWLVTADTFGTGAAVAASLGFQFHHVANGTEKRQFVEALGPSEVVAVGNGANDVAMFGIAAVSIAVLGPEGAAAAALTAADVVVPDIAAAFELLLYPTRLAATLRP